MEVGKSEQSRGGLGRTKPIRNGLPMTLGCCRMTNETDRWRMRCLERKRFGKEVRRSGKSGMGPRSAAESGMIGNDWECWVVSQEWCQKAQTMFLG